MKVLFTSPILEHPPVGGPQLRIENSIKALSKVCELHIASGVFQDQLGGIDGETFFRKYTNHFSYLPSVQQRSASFSDKVRRRLNRDFFHKDAQHLAEYVTREKIDVVWFGYGNISMPLIEKLIKLKPGIKTVCDTDSVWSRFLGRGIPFEKNQLRKLKIWLKTKQKESEERHWTNLCSATLAVSEVDAEYYRHIAKDPSRVLVFSNVIDLETYKDKVAPLQNYKHPNLYLAGSFGPKSPMEEAALWAIQKVLPLVKKEIPDIHFYIAGSGSKETLAQITDPAISIMGRQPSLVPMLMHTDVALVPLKFESGTRFKILEAAACGIPIVSTTLGAEGIPVEHKKDIWIGDTAEEFANGIVTFIRKKDFAQKTAEECRKLILKDFSVSTLESQARIILDYLVRN